MSRTDKTDPWRVRHDRGETQPYVNPCGTGCSYCGMGRTRKRFDTHRIRSAAKRALRVGAWKREY